MSATLDEESPSVPRRSRRRSIIAVVGVVLLAAAPVTYVVSEPNQRRTNDQLLMEAFKPLPPPARMVICRGEMDAACAQDAADRAGIPIAWMPVPQGYRLSWVIAARASNEAATASQYFVDADGGAGAIEVSSLVPPLGPSSDRVIGSASNGTDTATVQRDDLFGVTELTWDHDGLTYELVGLGVGPDTTPLVNAWRTVRYASPRNGG
jgi:hypothetical protein